MSFLSLRYADPADSENFKRWFHSRDPLWLFLSNIWFEKASETTNIFILLLHPGAWFFPEWFISRKNQDYLSTTYLIHFRIKCEVSSLETMIYIHTVSALLIGTPEGGTMVIFGKRIVQKLQYFQAIIFRKEQSAAPKILNSNRTPAFYLRGYNGWPIMQVSEVFKSVEFLNVSLSLKL